MTPNLKSQKTKTISVESTGFDRGRSVIVFSDFFSFHFAMPDQISLYCSLSMFCLDVLMFDFSFSMWLKFQCSKSGKGTYVEDLRSLSFSLCICIFFFGSIVRYLTGYFSFYTEREAIKQCVNVIKQYNLSLTLWSNIIYRSLIVNVVAF